MAGQAITDRKMARIHEGGKAETFGVQCADRTVNCDFHFQFTTGAEFQDPFLDTALFGVEDCTPRLAAIGTIAHPFVCGVNVRSVLNHITQALSI